MNFALAKGRKKINIDPSLVITLVFMFIILFGATLLTLPISSKEGVFTDFLSALFTATSATCVTGLVVVDTYLHWSTFGQVVIISLIQIGGLGFMTMATLFSLMVRRNISYRERMLMAQSLSLFNMKGVVRITKHILLGTLAFEGTGAIILSIRFIPEFGISGGIFRGIFTSISAFCNAGFDLMGSKGAFSSLTSYAEDITINIVVALLIIIGGLGFIVWEEIYTVHNFSKFSIYTKIVLITTGILILSGAILIFAAEFSNPATLEPLSMKGKILASFFQSVTPRTAGFNTIGLGSLRDITTVIITILMFIGAASGSTGGGIKVATASILIYTFISVLRGRKDVVIMKRHISQETVLRAFALTFMGFIMVLICSVIISFTNDFDFLSIMFECVSAFATVGLTVGITSLMSDLGLVLLIILMFFGRVGILTITYALFTRLKTSEDKIEYPEGKILIG